MSRSPTIIDGPGWSSNPEDWLPNPSAGEILATEFLDPLDMAAGDIAAKIDLPADRLAQVIANRAKIDAELDLRLARYFGMSEGFFLGLQIEYDLEEARRAYGSEIGRIIPRAA